MLSFVRMGNDWEDSGQADYARTAERAFGARIRDLRKSRQLNQEDLARLLSRLGRKSYHQTTIAKLENGSRPTSIAEIYLLAVILGVDVTDLFTTDFPSTDARVTDAIAQLRYEQLQATVARAHAELTDYRDRQSRLEAAYLEARQEFERATRARQAGRA